MGWRGVWEEDAAISLLLFPFEKRCPKALIRFFPSFFKKPLPPPPSEKKNRNKLGATLANAGRAHEAAAAYRKALDAKPNYVRAWTNMG